MSTGVSRKAAAVVLANAKSGRFSGQSLVVAGFCLLAVLAAYLRLYYGVDLTDESVYTAIPWAFVMGNRPWMHEINLQQTSSMLLTPFVWLWLKAVGSADGVILYMRHVFFAFAAFTAWSVWRAFRDQLGREAAWLLAASVMAFIPFSIPAPSYNTQATFFLLNGCLFAHRAFSEGRARHLAVSGVFLALMSFAYLTFAPLPFVFFALLVARRRDPEAPPRFLWYWLVAFAAVSCLLLPLMFISGWQGIYESYAFNRASGAGGGTQKFLSILNTAVQLLPWPALNVLFVVAVAAVVKYFRFRPAWILFCYPISFLAVLGAERGFTMVAPFVTYLSILGGLLYWVSRRDAIGWRVVRMVWFPGTLAGLLMCWSSANGYINHGIGAFTAFIATAALLARSESAVARPLRSPAHALLMLVIVGELFFAWRYTYRDDFVESLSARVPAGPYAGLLTTPERNRYLAQIRADIQQTAQHAASFAEYDLVPAMYLFSNMKPKCRGMGIEPPTMMAYDRSFLVDFYLRPENQPDAVLEVWNVPIGHGQVLAFGSPDVNLVNEAFFQFFERRLGYKRVIERADYRILMRQGR